MQKYISFLGTQVTRPVTRLIGYNLAFDTHSEPVILSEAKNLTRHIEILRFAQNDRLDSLTIVKLTSMETSSASTLQWRCLPISYRVGAGLVPTLVNALMICLLALLITSCSWPGAQQTSQPDPRLKAFHVLSARIIMLDTQAEVDGTLQNTSRTDRFPYDVTIIATFYNNAGNIVGQAGGVAEDVYPGMISSFTLVGQVDSTQYSHMVVTVISLKERRIEKLIPTPSIVP